MGNNSSCCCSCSPSNEDYEDLITKLDTVKEMSEVDRLISYIDQLLNAIDQERQVATTAQVGSSPSINSAGGLLEAVLKRSKHICKRVIMPNLNRETRKFVIDVTNQAARIKWVGVALSVVGFVLERTDQISSNKNECIGLLKYMCYLAKYIKQLDEHLGEEKLKRALQFIVKGCLMCISQMESDALSKFFAAPIAAEDLQKFKAELGHEYQELSLEAIIEVLNRNPVVLPPSQGVSPQTVGLDEAKKHVTELLGMKGGSVKVVVIWGQGGIGKTTLATAVFSKLDLKAYKYCRVVMEQNCLEKDLKLLQQQILGDLFGRNINLRDLIEGGEKLSEEFSNSSQPVFIFIDNALKESDLEKLLPISALTSLPAQSRILLTTRNLNETLVIEQARIARIPYRVASLPRQDALKFLSVYAFGSDQESFDPDIDINGLLDICQGIPLALQLAGKRLSQNRQNCKEEVEYLKSRLLEGKGEISERMVDFVYHRLDDSCKEGFLDIVFFFINWERSIVASAIGEIEFQELQRAALVNIMDEDRVNVHDIVKARGRILSLENGERITDEESLTDVLQNEDRIKKTKGICLHGWFDFELKASRLNLMKKCLRVLILRGGTKKVNGECNGAFENLRLLSLENDNIYSQMDVSKHRRLAVLILRYRVASNFPEVASITSSLKYVFIENATLVNFSTILSQFQTLRSLALKNCRGFESLPETIRCLHALEKLDLSYCSNLTSLSNSFGNLSSLTELNLINCSSLASLSNNFGNLVGLVKLDLSVCSNLTSLPESFGNLSSLTELDLSYCTQLSVLPESFGNLGSLEKLILQRCEKLLNLPQNFGQLKRLRYLNIDRCRVLQTLSDDFECLSSLVAVRASKCSQLEENAMDKLAKTKGLMVVAIEESPMLQRRWEQVKGQYSLFVRTQAYWSADDDVMLRAFYHSESKFVYVDENGVLGECASPAVGVTLCVLLTACDLTSPSNSGYLEAVKRKWMELAGEHEDQMLLVEVGSSWEESERRVRETLPLLPRGSSCAAWIAPDERARLLFADNLLMDDGDLILRISTFLDEDGRGNLSVRSHQNTADFGGSEYRDNWYTILSPINEARNFIGD